MKTSYNRLSLFVTNAQVYLKNFPGETKLKYALEKVLKRLPIDSINTEYSEAMQDLEADHANTDERGSLLYQMVDGKKEFDYTPAGLKSLRAAKRELSQELRFEVKEHIAPEVPEDFPEEFRPIFEGFVLAPSEPNNQQDPTI